MMLALDPELFVAAFQKEKKSKLALIGYSHRLDECRFVVDRGADSITRRYLNLYDEFNRIDSPVPDALEVLGKIIQDFNDDRATIVNPEQSAITIQELIAAHKIETPYEPHLVRLAWSLYGKATGQSRRGDENLNIVLVGPSASYESPCRERRLYDPAVAREVWRKIPWVHISFATETEVLLPGTKPLEPEPEQQHHFETMAREHIRSHFRCWTYFDPTPPEIKKKHGDVDVYVFEPTGIERNIWIGECKLRVEGTGNPVNGDDMRRFSEKICAVDNFEKERDELSGSHKIHAFIITNAETFDEDATLEVEKIKKWNIPVMKILARLSPHWSRDEHWRVKEWIWL